MPIATKLSTIYIVVTGEVYTPWIIARLYILHIPNCEKCSVCSNYSFLIVDKSHASKRNIKMVHVSLLNSYSGT